MTIEEIRDLLASALQALETPAAANLIRAERLVDQADEALRELIDPPDPYKDMNVRRGLNYIDPTGKFPEGDDHA